MHVYPLILNNLKYYYHYWSITLSYESTYAFCENNNKQTMNLEYWIDFTMYLIYLHQVCYLEDIIFPLIPELFDS